MAGARRAATGWGGGLRQFNDLRGNKRFKLGLEACVAIPGDGDDLLLAFGSGSSPLREHIAVIRDGAGPAPHATLIDAPELYATLRAATSFAGSDMNIEGAVFLGGASACLVMATGWPATACCRATRHAISTGRRWPPISSTLARWHRQHLR